MRALVSGIPEFWKPPSSEGFLKVVEEAFGNIPQSAELLNTCHRIFQVAG